MRTCKLISALLLTLASGVVLALEPPPGKPPVRNYPMSEYQSHLINWKILQAPDQRIVVGGGDGLVIFDGASWQAIPSRHSNRVRAMAVDEAGRIWAGSPDEFGYFEAGADGGLVYHSLIDDLPDELRNFGEALNVYVIGDSVYLQALRHLFRWRDDELSIFQSWDGVFRTSLVHRDRLMVLVRDRFYDFTELPDDVTADGTPPEPEPGWSMPRGPRLSSLSSWPDGRILMGTVAHGLFWLSDDEPLAIETDFDFSEAWIYRAIPAPDGGILAATRHQGLFHLGPDGRAIEQVSHRNGLASNAISDLIIDHENGVWLAQEGVIARVDLFGGRRIYDADFGLSATKALLPFQGRWLIGGNGGLSVLSADGHDASRQQRIETPILEAFGVLEDGDGLLVGGTDGLHRIVPDLENLNLVHHERLLYDKTAYRILRSRFRDAVYVELDSGVGVIAKTDQGWHSLGKVEGVNRRTDTIAEDATGRVWVGTSVGRYFRLAWHGDELVLEAELTAEDGVPEDYAWAFNLGERLVLGSSLGAYRPVEPDALRVEPDPDFGNEQLTWPGMIYRLFAASDGQVVGGIGKGGTLWRGTLSDDGRFNWHGRWMTDLEPAINSFIGKRGGYLWIGRHPGLLRLDWPPKEAEITPSRLQVVRAGFPDTDQWLIAGPAVNGFADALPPRPESLRFEYALTSYSAPDLTEYRVRLDGLERDWSRWSREPRRDYTNLPGGSFVFQVQARNSAGQTFESAPLAFRVLPPLYLSPLAWAIYALAALLLLALAARFGQRMRERKLLAQKRVLAQQVAERTAEVRAQAREIRQISDARARFFANVSHELRTPLTLTRAPLQELARTSRGILDAESKQYLDVALRNSEAMQSLIGQILDLQRLDAGRMPLNLVRADMASIVRGIVDRFAVQARLRHINLSLEGGDTALMLVCDQVHIDTMLSNLLSNAIKFTPQGGTVDVALTESGEHVELSVSDTGPGIAPAHQQSIFERFRQGEQTSASSPGTGIGLALVRELAELHGGNIRVHSLPGKGASFTLSLPVNLQPNASASHESGAVEAQEERLQQHTEASIDEMSSEDVPCVLLVDDNAELRAFLRLRLGRSYRIEEAADGAEGLRRARELTPDAIITDGLMPVMDGLAMTRAIKADPELAFVPILMLTSRAGPEDAVRGLEAGADDYLSKPFDSAELSARVAGLIASRKRLKARVEEPGSEATAAGESRFMNQVHRVLDEHLGDPQFSVRDWADLMHMDRTTLFRRLKAETGQSSDDYLRERRLQAAARLLRERAGNVAEVADAVGYASVSHFSRRFRERFKATPAAYARDAAD